MFAQEDMLGLEDRIVTEKGRIILPDFCNAEENDVLVILKLSDYIEIWEYNMFFDELNNFRENSFMYSDEITAFIAKTDVQVDFTKRINLTKQLTDEYFKDRKVKVEGKGKFIRIWSLEKFLECRNNLEDELNLSVLTRKRGKQK